MDAEFSFYQLEKKTKLNSQDILPQRNGALIKLTDGLNWGVADICPKPELGDSNLDLEIKQQGPLYLRAYDLALEDLLARKNKKSLLNNKSISNNYLITNYANENLNDYKYIDSTVKIKCDIEISNLINALVNIKNDFKIRLDFNSCLSVQLFEDFLRQLPQHIINKIEYIEDPTLICDEWKIWNQKIPLAFDFQKWSYNAVFAKYQIIKPSRQALIRDNNFTLTSAMEHPVGLAHALRIAQNSAVNESGFLVLDLYKETQFHKYFTQTNNEINFSTIALNDFGIGMTEELSRLKWTAF